MGGTGSGEGSRSSGFETLLGKIVVDRGLAASEEVEACRDLQKQNPGSALSDLLIDRAFVTRSQLDRLRGELEAERSQQRLPGYKVIRKLGAGAMATVYLAKQLSLDRLVAIKLLPKKFSNDPKFIERFYKEGRAAARLNDQHVVQAYDVGQAGDSHFFVMEYVDGETVYDRLVRHKRFKESDAIEIVRQVAMALKHAHAQGFIHRDIKPKNIMLSRSGVVKLADLGLARAVSDKEAAEAEAGKAYGTPYYISPEQVRGQVDIGPPADIYGLGATFYHMVTGRLPFEGKNPSEVMHKHLKAELVPPDHVNPQLTGGTAQIIEMMLAKNPRDRYHSAAELLEDLDAVTKGMPPLHAKPALDLGAIPAAVPAALEPTRVRHSGGPSSALVITLSTLLVLAVVVIVALLLRPSG
ncbi:MAG: serine/threonine protein kinase [Phycisphaeraceae bacterium]|nr:serine/threonine protein kinase [Phycisphaeraceae bacterium]